MILTKLVAIIPTRERPQDLRNALQSISGQTLHPEIVLVVVESNDRTLEVTKETCMEFSSSLNVILVRNTRTANLSGALNSALDFLLKNNFSPDDCYLAFLDDDDRWETDYLEICSNTAYKGNYDWVYAGIIRHDSQNSVGKPLSIPYELTVGAFFTGNPHIQGSNLFVRFMSVLKAGGFDESLNSATDRDICIRLLDLGNQKISRIDKHLVHHFAYQNRNRISEPSSPRKEQGLHLFYLKYAVRMTPIEQTAFTKRASRLFKVDIDPNFYPASPDQKIAQSQQSPESDICFVVGIIATRTDSLKLLLGDLSKLNEEEPIISKVVILDNSPSSQMITEDSWEGEFSNLNLIIHSRSKLNSKLKSNSFGDYISRTGFDESIAMGRTVLHHLLYKESVDVHGSVIWVIDDDIRLSYLSRNGTDYELQASHLVDETIRLKETGASIGVLGITGDPPLPGISTLRTQLLDLFYSMNSVEERQELVSSISSASWAVLREQREYFYDYSNVHSSHLEFPTWINLDETSSLLRILQGKSLTRPQTWSADCSEELDFVPVGGSYLVLNPDCLREFPVTSPYIGQVFARRGDTFWGILNRYLRGRIVTPCPIAVQQSRISEDECCLSFDKLFADFVGSSFVRAISDYYKFQEEQLGTLPARISLYLSHNAIDDIADRFLMHLEARRIQFLLNSMRIQGLLESITQLEAFKQNAFQIRELVRTLQPMFSSSRIKKFSERLNNINTASLKGFLGHLKSQVNSYRASCPHLEYDTSYLLYSKSITASLISAPSLQFLGKGREGIVWSDGKYAYKHFASGWSQFERGQKEFIKTEIFQRTISDNLVKLEDIIEDSGELLFKLELMEGDVYEGGHLDEIRGLLTECKQNGISISNIHPNNFVVGKKGLKFCDVGRSLIPYNEREFMSMAKRTYLTYRFHYRDDIDEIMARALYDDSLPELFGFGLFLESLELKKKSEVLDEDLIELVKSKHPQNIMDYGCGDGRISEKLFSLGIDVVAFDPAERLIETNTARDTSVNYVNSKGLQSFLNSKHKFDCVLCSLVLCTIEDDNEVMQAISNIRQLVADKGRVIVAVCNPFFFSVSESDLHIKCYHTRKLSYDEKNVYEKIVRETSRKRIDVHRPFRWYEDIFHQHGFSIESCHETSDIDTKHLLPSSEFLIFDLKPITMAPSSEEVSLLIKASPMEWRTIDFQIRHIVNQLEGPQRFVEKIIITDRHDGPFLRQYDEPNHEEFKEKIEILVRENIVDKVVFAPLDASKVRQTLRRWFDLDSEMTHSEIGQHIFTTLYGFERCEGKYVLQLDSDCIIYRPDRNHDYLSDMIQVLEQNPDALTVSFNTPHSEDIPYDSLCNGKPWRVEVRFCLLNKEKLMNQLPLPNLLTPDGTIKNAWHRALDNLIQSSRLESYRGGSAKTFYIHVPNDRKPNLIEWYNIIKSVERGNMPDEQIGHVNLKGTLSDWIGSRDEEYVFIIRGRNTYIPLLRRCIDSVKEQTDPRWGVVLIDAASENGMDEYVENMITQELEGRVSVLRNYNPLPAIQNIVMATKVICTNPETIIIHLDADDALIGSNVLEILGKNYSRGADTTVGSMLRLDKQKEYPVDFDSPRANRGGNVWQHLRTFKKYLFDSISEEDLKIDGEWVPIAEDWAFMLPIIEMASNPVHIKQPLYFYAPGGEKTDETRAFREEIIGKIVNKPPYPPSDVNRS